MMTKAPRGKHHKLTPTGRGCLFDALPESW